jgi:hypothetical protein
MSVLAGYGYSFNPHSPTETCAERWAAAQSTGRTSLRCRGARTRGPSDSSIGPRRLVGLSNHASARLIEALSESEQPFNRRAASAMPPSSSRRTSGARSALKLSTSQRVRYSISASGDGITLRSSHARRRYVYDTFVQFSFVRRSPGNRHGGRGRTAVCSITRERPSPLPIPRRLQLVRGGPVARTVLGKDSLPPGPPEQSLPEAATRVNGSHLLHE